MIQADHTSQKKAWPTPRRDQDSHSVGPPYLPQAFNGWSEQKINLPFPRCRKLMLQIGSSIFEKWLEQICYLLARDSKRELCKCYIQSGFAGQARAGHKLSKVSTEKAEGRYKWYYRTKLFNYLFNCSSRKLCLKQLIDTVVSELHREVQSGFHTGTQHVSISPCQKKSTDRIYIT